MVGTDHAGIATQMLVVGAAQPRGCHRVLPVTHPETVLREVFS